MQGPFQEPKKNSGTDPVRAHYGCNDSSTYQLKSKNRSRITDSAKIAVRNALFVKIITIKMEMT